MHRAIYMPADVDADVTCTCRSKARKARKAWTKTTRVLTGGVVRGPRDGRDGRDGHPPEPRGSGSG